MKLKPFDYSMLVLSVLITAGLSIYAYSARGERKVVAIQGENRSWVYPIEQDRIVDVPGPLGITEVVIRNGTARVISSPCKNKICISSGPISVPGTFVACLPNRVFVRIEGNKTDEIDSTSF